MPHIQPFTPSYPIQLPQSTHSPPLHPIPASPVQASISSAACPPRALRAYSPGLCLLTPVARGQPALLVNRGLCSFLEKVDRMRTLGISSQNNHWHRKTFNIYCLCREGGKSRFQKEDPRLVKTLFTSLIHAYSILLSTYCVPGFLPAPQERAVNSTAQVPGLSRNPVSKLLGITVQPADSWRGPPLSTTCLCPPSSHQPTAAASSSGPQMCHVSPRPPASASVPAWNTPAMFS